MEKLIFKTIKIYFKTLSRVSPALAARSAFSLFQTVRLKRIRTAERPFFEEAEKYRVEIPGQEDLDCYEFGNKESKDLVVLVHGWDSNAGSMYAFVEPLLKQNKRIVSFNQPGHAFHTSNKTNMHASKEAFKEVLGNLPTHDKLSIIAHSYGTGVSAYALSEMDIKVDQLVLLSPLNKMEDVFQDFKKLIKLSDTAYKILTNKVSEITKELVSEFVIESKLAKANFGQLHLMHDKHDKVVPHSNSISISKRISNSTLDTFEKVGHYRMLWNKEVIDKVIGYCSAN